MVKIEMGNGSGQSFEVEGGISLRTIMLRVRVKDADATRTLAAVSLSPAECEALENALRIQRREAERRRK